MPIGRSQGQRRHRRGGRGVSTDRDISWATADGYVAGTDGTLDWVVPDEEQARAAAASISSFDPVRFGRRTYEPFEGSWGDAAVDESGAIPDPHTPGRRSSEHGAIAVALNRMTKLVSRSLKDATGRNSRVLRDLVPRGIETMKTPIRKGPDGLWQRLHRVAAHAR
jgi:dihydrofolate reductase